MTTVIAVENDGDVVFGYDSQTTRGNFITYSRNRKVFRNGNIVFASAGPVRGADILRNMNIPERGSDTDTDTYLYTVLVPAIISVFSKNNFAEYRDHKVESDTVAIIAYEGRIYLLGPDFSLISPESGIAAYGSGSDYALGAFEALQEQTTLESIRTSLNVAASFDAFTGGEIRVIRASEVE